MSFNFDKIIDRRGTGAIKYDRRPELDPFWVADMDFESAPPIIEALQQRVAHGVFGYAHAHAGLTDAILDYLETRRAARVDAGHIVHLGGLVPALSLAVRAFCKPGESIMTCTPIYPPFRTVKNDGDVRLINVDHVLADGEWTFDWDAMENAVQPDTRIFLLSNPQNPLGRVLTRAELERLATFCENHGLLLVSDEIHCDLVYDGDSAGHVSALNLTDAQQQNIITLLSPSKTWNIAGLGYAYAIITSDEVRQRFNAVRGHTLPEINALSFYAAEAAYRHGEPWRLAALDYLRANRDLLVETINRPETGLKTRAPQATYLAWIDATAWNVPNPAEHLEKTAGLFVSDGAFFGKPGHIRFNFACPRARMIEGLEKLVNSAPR